MKDLVLTDGVGTRLFPLTFTKQKTMITRMAEPADLLRRLYVKEEGTIFGYEIYVNDFQADVRPPERYIKAEEGMLKKVKRDEIMEENVEIYSSGKMAPAVIGESVVVEENSSVGSLAAIFDDFYVGGNSNAEQCFNGGRTVTRINTCILKSIMSAHANLEMTVSTKN